MFSTLAAVVVGRESVLQRWEHDCSKCSRRSSDHIRWTIVGGPSWSEGCVKLCEDNPDCRYAQTNPGQWGAGCFLFKSCSPIAGKCEEWHVYQKPVKNLLKELEDDMHCPKLQCGMHCTVKYDFFQRGLLGKATFSCERGYHLFGPAEVSCDIGHTVGPPQWSDHAPYCAQNATTTTTIAPFSPRVPHIVRIGQGFCRGDWHDRSFTRIQHVSHHECETDCADRKTACTGFAYSGHGDGGTCFLYRKPITSAYGNERYECYAKAVCLQQSCGEHCQVSNPVPRNAYNLAFVDTSVSLRCTEGSYMSNGSSTAECKWRESAQAAEWMPNNRYWASCTATTTPPPTSGSCKPLPTDKHGKWSISFPGNKKPGAIAYLKCDVDYCVYDHQPLHCDWLLKWELSKGSTGLQVCGKCKIKRFEVESGDCVADTDGCVQAQSGSCYFLALYDGLLTVENWKVVDSSLNAHGVRFTGSNPPISMTFFKGEVFDWHSPVKGLDSFKVCWRPLGEHAFTVTVGACIAQSDCVAAPHPPKSGIVTEGCTFKANQGGMLVTSATEPKYFDVVRWDNTTITAGQTITWNPPAGVAYRAWKICLEVDPNPVSGAFEFVMVFAALQIIFCIVICLQTM